MQYGAVGSSRAQKSAKKGSGERSKLKKSAVESSRVQLVAIGFHSVL